MGEALNPHYLFLQSLRPNCLDVEHKAGEVRIEEVELKILQWKGVGKIFVASEGFFHSFHMILFLV